MSRLKFKDLSIKKRSNIFFILIIIITALALIVPLYYKVSDVLKCNTQAQSLETVNQIKTSIDHSLDTVANMANFISYSSDIQKYLNLENDETLLTHQDYSTAERVMITNYSSIILRDIDIYGDNGMIFNVPSRFTDRSAEQIAAYTETAREGRGKITWHNAIQETDTLELLKEIRDITSTQSLGTLRIGINRSYLEKQLRNVTFGNDGYTIILDNEGKYLAGKNLTPKKYEVLLACMDSTDGTSRISLDSSNYLIAYNTIPDKGMIILGVIPERSLYKDINNLKTWLVTIVLLTCLFGFLLAVKFSASIVTPLRDMAKSMDIVANGNFNHTLPVNSNDEIGRLSSNFNTMIFKINALIDSEYKQALLKKEAEFKMLQAQINPHFFYNALETINWIAKKNQMDEISTMVTSISKLMRISINNKQKTITLKEELDCIKGYLAIQKVRYQDRIQTMIDIPYELYSMVIPKLTLQPLVENAFVHGLEQSESQGMVIITGKHQENVVVFCVADNGIGMSEEQIEKIMDDKLENNPSHSGLGIMTVHKRIQFVYGQEYGLTIESKSQKGTKMILKIPYIIK